MRKKLRVTSCESRVSDKTLASARHAHSGTRNAILATRNSSAFTLIELLVTMVIVSIIAAAVLGTAGAALDAARRSRTETVINRIHLLLMERWETYETRRIDFNPALEASLRNVAANNPILGGQMRADARLLAIRELMKMELPNRWTDITDGPVILQGSGINGRPSALVQSYWTKYLSVESHPKIATNQAAECLYLIVMLGTGDGEARSQFTDQDIGDTDGDGAPEFLDGWGNPIQWIRWPAGFVERSPMMSGDGVNDHDPFDLYRRDIPDAPRPAPSSYPNAMKTPISQIVDRNRIAKSTSNPQLVAFRLIPLIYSVGPDAEVEPDGEILNKGYRFLDESDSGTLDPYFVANDGFQAGQPDPNSKAWADNITNHSIEY